MKRFFDVATLSLAIALVAGGAEALVAAFRQTVLGQIVFVSPDYAWMAPTAYALLVVPAALVAYGVSVVIRRPMPPAFVMGMVTAVTAFAVLLPHTVIAWWASTLVALGAGIRMWRTAASSDPARYVPWARRIALAAALLATVAGVTMRVSNAWAERTASAALPAAQADAPNVLLIVLDTVRATNIGTYGYAEARTARMDHLALEGVAFERAISTAPWTLPSHASLLTGLPAAATGADWRRPMRADAPTLAEVLSARGYATGAFVANLIYTPRGTGLERGFAHYDDYQWSWQSLLLHSSLSRIDLKSDLPTARTWPEIWKALVGSHVASGGLEPTDVFRRADHVADAFLRWHQDTAGRPFFAFLNFFDAHAPYRRPASIENLSDEIVASKDRDGYDAAIGWLDHVIGEILDSLRQRNALDRTIVVITADHGEHLGEHDLTGHANSLYLPLLHVPLIIRYPAGVPSGTRVAEPVTLQDVPATILALAGPGRARLPGRSLTGYWASEGRPASEIVSEVPKGVNLPDPAARNRDVGLVSRLDRRFHYIRNAKGEEELYDYRADPEEAQNLAADPAFRDDLARLGAGLTVP